MMRYNKPASRLLLLLALSVRGLSAAAAAAADEDSRISADRPDLLTSSNVVGRGRLQLELGGLVKREDAGSQRTRTAHTPFLLRLGLSDSLELRVESDGRMRSRETDVWTHTTNYENGWADVAFGVKWNTHKGDAARGTPAVSWIVQAELPSGSASSRGRGVRPKFISAVDWKLQNDWNVNVNAGATYDNHETEGRHLSGLLGAGLTWGITDKLKIVGEVVAQELRRAKYGGSVVVADLGIRYLLTPSFQLDALTGIGLSSDAPKYLFGIGGAARF